MSAATRIPTLTAVPGPWGERYTVTRATLATNLACATLATMTSAQLAYSVPTDVYDLTADGLVWIEDQPTSSIYGFWFEQLRRLTPAQLASVRNLATSYLMEQRTGGKHVQDRPDR